jgi:hypothetical protein
LRSRLVPAWLAYLGLAASIILAACTGTFVVYPVLAKTFTIAFHGGPIFVFKLSMGFWLVIKAIRSR